MKKQIWIAYASFDPDAPTISPRMLGEYEVDTFEQAVECYLNEHPLFRPTYVKPRLNFFVRTEETHKIFGMPLYENEADVLSAIESLHLKLDALSAMIDKDEMELLSCPGDTILETIESRGVNISMFATYMRMPVKETSKLISGRAPITDQIATKLESVLGIDRQFWLNSEKIYREKLDNLQKKVKQ